MCRGLRPRGLAAAHDLAAVGMQVTLLEAFDEPGGMLRYGIPEFRLPRDVLSAEIAAILRHGITLKTGVRVGRDVSVEQLLSDYDAVLIAADATRPNRWKSRARASPALFPALIS